METCRQILKWCSDVDKVCAGLNVTTLANKCPVVETLMHQSSLATFRAGMTKMAQATMDGALEAADDDPAGAAIHANGVDHHLHADHISHSLNFVVANHFGV